ncbi:hypothetical protein QBC42DRAFT_199892 [Cladorrhinum samala]|uniref:Uncharacterized protein n=1 Tax=Cladorrhinum samala TaxID=585594 RepID=A0AAV9HQA7_9PEZI|nr:hypothetical protein QBC42DRAFT_199892 [Cladorrhinum samala]
MDRPPRARPIVHDLSLRYLVVPPVILAALTAAVLFQHSDTNIYMLYSQCHARSRLPSLTGNLPLLGSPLCFVVSFFQESAASLRSSALLAVIFSFLSGLLTVSTVEAARVCNKPNPLIAYPTGSWLIFDLVGGAFVWELLFLPAFFHRSREIINSRRAGEPSGLPAGAADPTFGESMRHLAGTAEAVAIPAAVALGFVVPSVLLLTLDSAATAAAWLLFPIWVSLIRQAVRKALGLVVRAGESWRETLHLESSRVALVGMYAVPVACSVLAQAFLVWNLTARPDDRKEMTRATVKFIAIDAFFVGLTVLYWILVEAGWRVALVMAAASAVLGPGAGISLGWIYREQTVNPDRSVTVVAVGAPRGSDDGHTSEETPLLR